MDYKEAIEVFKSNYPDSSYSMLREAVDFTILKFENKIKEKSLQELANTLSTEQPNEMRKIKSGFKG